MMQVLRCSKCSDLLFIIASITAPLILLDINHAGDKKGIICSFPQLHRHKRAYLFCTSLIQRGIIFDVCCADAANITPARTFFPPSF